MNAKAIAAATITLGASAAVVACILADPPPIVTPPPQNPPLILQLSVTPPPPQVLTTNPPCTNDPNCFVVPVLLDPNASVKWRVFVDLDETGSPTQGYGPSGQDDGGVLAVPPDAGPAVRTFSFNPMQNLAFDPSKCHTITFIIAYDFFADDFWKPFPPGLGNSVTWRYEPVDNCTAYDAGLPPEAGTD